MDNNDLHVRQVRQAPRHLHPAFTLLVSASLPTSEFDPVVGFLEAEVVAELIDGIGPRPPYAVRATLLRKAAAAYEQMARDQGEMAGS